MNDQEQEVGTAVATTDEKPTLGTTLAKLRRHVLAVLPKQLDADRLLRLALLASQKQPLLQSCTLESVARSVMYAAQLGLEPGRTLHLIPFKRNDRETGRTIYECTPVPDYRGLIELAERSGRVSMVDAALVYEDDDFVYQLGTDPKIHHVPDLDGDRTDAKIKGAYCVATRVNGMRQFSFATRKEIDATRARSRAKDNGPWVTDYGRMAMKTAVKKLSPYLPQTPEFSAAIELDNRSESGQITMPSDILDTVDSIAATQEDPGRGTKSLKAAVQGRVAHTTESAAPAGAQPASPQTPAEPPQPAKSAKPGPAAATPVTTDAVALVSKAQSKAVWQSMDAAKLPSSTRAEILDAVGATNTEDIPADRLNDVMELIKDSK